MTTAVKPVTYGGYEAFRRFTVAEYDQMIAAGILDDEDKVELLEGHVVLKMPRDPRHDATIQLMLPLVYPICPPGWGLRIQSAVALPVSESQPEPDFAIVRGSGTDYLTRHPGPADLALVVEVSYSSLVRDTQDKTRIYATDGIPEYWVINLVDRRIEVYSRPGGGRYQGLKTYTPGDTIPLTIGGTLVSAVAVDRLLP